MPLKISRIRGKKIDNKKIKIVSFFGAMHGKTLGALMVGGKTKEKRMDWKTGSKYSSYFISIS